MNDTSKKSPNWVAFSLIILFIIFVASLLTYLYFTGGLKDIIGDPSAPQTKSEKSAEAQISITKDGFVPATITVKKDTAVTWTNNDDQAHQVASDPHPNHTLLKDLGDGEALAKGDSFTFTFDKSGTFTYHDHLNPVKFSATVVVQ